MAFVVTSACIDETEPECVAVCHCDAIKAGRFTRFIDPTLCDDCGLCAPVCPVGAIYAPGEVPYDEQEWIIDRRPL